MPELIRSFSCTVLPHWQILSDWVKLKWKKCFPSCLVNSRSENSMQSFDIFCRHVHSPQLSILPLETSFHSLQRGKGTEKTPASPPPHPKKISRHHHDRALKNILFLLSTHLAQWGPTCPAWYARANIWNDASTFITALTVFWALRFCLPSALKVGYNQL